MGLVTVTVILEALAKTTTAVAISATGGEIVIVGADVYPEPPETKVIPVTVPVVKTAVADAPVPPPPENDIIGAVA